MFFILFVLAFINLRLNALVKSMTDDNKEEIKRLKKNNRS